MSTAAVILARAGSKGVPGKNARLIAGRPCVEWTIDAAQRSSVDHVVVSTDCPRVCEAAQRMGTTVIDRPAHLATDGARVDDAARHAVGALDGTGARVKTIVILYANVPIRPSDLIDRALALQFDTNCDSVQSYCRVGKHHPWWTCRVDHASGRVMPWEGDVLNHGIFRRQDLPEALVPDGGVLVVSRGALMLEIKGVAAGPHAFFGVDRRGIITSEGDVVDIDSEIDALVADALLRRNSCVGSAP